MKKAILLRIVAFVALATAGVATAWYWRKALDFRHEVQCRLAVRGIIGQAKLSYATWKGLRNGSPISAQAITSYFEEDRLPCCPSGGHLTIGAIGEPVHCSLGRHARPPCNDFHDLNPVDMAHDWWMAISGTSRGAMVNLSGVRILFSDVQWGKGGCSVSTITIAGTGTSRSSGQSRTGGCVYNRSETYSNGIATIGFAGHVFQLTDNGTSVVFGDKTFQIGVDRPTILVNKENEAKLVSAWRDLED